MSQMNSLKRLYFYLCLSIGSKRYNVIYRIISHCELEHERPNLHQITKYYIRFDYKRNKI